MERTREQLINDLALRFQGVQEVTPLMLRNQLADIVDSMVMPTDILLRAFAEQLVEAHHQIDQLAARLDAAQATPAPVVMPAPELEGHIHITGTSCPMVLSTLDGNPLVSVPSAPAGEAMELTLVFTETSVFEVRGAAFRVHPGSPWMVGSDQSFKGCNLYIQANTPETPGTSKRVDIVTDLGTVVWMITAAQA